VPQQHFRLLAWPSVTDCSSNRHSDLSRYLAGVLANVSSHLVAYAAAYNERPEEEDTSPRPGCADVRDKFGTKTRILHVRASLLFDSRPRLTAHCIRRDAREPCPPPSWTSSTGSLCCLRSTLITFLLLTTNPATLCTISGIHDSCLASVLEANTRRTVSVDGYENESDTQSWTSLKPGPSSQKQHNRHDASCCVVQTVLWTTVLHAWLDTRCGCERRGFGLNQTTICVLYLGQGWTPLLIRACVDGQSIFFFKALVSYVLLHLARPPFWLCHVFCPCSYPAVRRDRSPAKGRPFDILAVDVWPRVLLVLNGSKVVERVAVERSVLMLSVVRVCGEVRVPPTDIMFEHIHISINYSMSIV